MLVNLRYIKDTTTVKKILSLWHFSPCLLPPSAKCTCLWILTHLDFQILLNFYSHLLKNFLNKTDDSHHHLDNTDTYSVELNGNEAENKIERKNSMKILDMKVDQHLTWEEHAVNVIMWYITITEISKNVEAYKLRKTLAEALILSEIDYGGVVYQNVPTFLIKGLQNVQMISPGYVLNRCAKECDVIKFGRLPIIERFEFNTTKLAFNALNRPERPDYLPLKFDKSNCRVTPRNSDDYRLPCITDKNTFKSDAYIYYNYLPLDLMKEINIINIYLLLKVFSLILHLQGFRSFFLSNSNKRNVCATAPIFF